MGLKHSTLCHLCLARTRSGHLWVRQNHMPNGTKDKWRSRRHKYIENFHFMSTWNKWMFKTNVYKWLRQVRGSPLRQLKYDFPLFGTNRLHRKPCIFHQSHIRRSRIFLIHVQCDRFGQWSNSAQTSTMPSAVPFFSGRHFRLLICPEQGIWLWFEQPICH